MQLLVKLPFSCTCHALHPDWKLQHLLIWRELQFAVHCGANWGEPGQWARSLEPRPTAFQHSRARPEPKGLNGAPSQSYPKSGHLLSSSSIITLAHTEARSDGILVLGYHKQELGCRSRPINKKCENYESGREAIPKNKGVCRPRKDK